MIGTANVRRDVLPIDPLPYQGMGRCELARRTHTRVTFL